MSEISFKARTHTHGHTHTHTHSLSLDPSLQAALQSIALELWSIDLNREVKCRKRVKLKGKGVLGGSMNLLTDVKVGGG